MNDYEPPHHNPPDEFEANPETERIVLYKCDECETPYDVEEDALDCSYECQVERIRRGCYKTVGFECPECFTLNTWVANDNNAICDKCKSLVTLTSAPRHD